MTDRELIEKWIKPGAIVPVTIESVTILVNALRDRLAQPEPEPVAWWDGKESVVFAHDTIDTPNWTDYWTKPLYADPTPCKTCEALARTVMMDQTSHDTAPPKREWVGLTDDEIYEYADKFLYQHGSNYGIKSFGKAIEAKLKEKNNG